MQSRQFCYWLQGSFELNGNTEFDEGATQILKDHLALVFQYDSKPNGFCCFLNGYFTLGKPESINAETTSIIKEKLRNTFKFEIDPSYPANEQKQLNDIHNGPQNSRFEAMC
jgi:hypothetical protein